jgi:4-oxalmesaconate hydratase
MIIDAHSHVSAPPELYAYKSQLLAGRGYHGKGNPGISDERMEQGLQRHLKAKKEVGTDYDFISPRPFQLMHSEKPASVVHYWVETINDIIGRQCKTHPEVFRGVCGLPQVWGEPVKNCIPELERCVKELGFVGCLINPDPSEGQDNAIPPMGEEYWYPLYEKMVELDVPGLVHSAGCNNPRESYSAHFITEESVATLSLCSSKVFQVFPKLRIIVAHGGGSVPYQVGRWRAYRWGIGQEQPHTDHPFDEDLKKLYFDTVLYTPESLDLLFNLVGTDRCMFGTENPGSGSAKDPKTGKWLDDLKPTIEGIKSLTAQDKKNIFEDTARKVFPRFKETPKAAAAPAKAPAR